MLVCYRVVGCVGAVSGLSRGSVFAVLSRVVMYVLLPIVLMSRFRVAAVTMRLRVNVVWIVIGIRQMR